MLSPTETTVVHYSTLLMYCTVLAAVLNSRLHGYMRLNLTCTYVILCDIIMISMIHGHGTNSAVRCSPADWSVGIYCVPRATG